MKGAKTAAIPVLAASLAAAVPVAVLADSLEEPEKPTREFAGQLKTEVRKVDSYLLVKHTFTSDELESRNVDHIYREELVPIPENATQAQIDAYASTSATAGPKKLEIIHEKDSARLSEFQKSENKGIPAHTFQKWNIVGMGPGAGTTEVLYRTSTSQVSYEDWASKAYGRAYAEYDPINLIWDDASVSSVPLIQRVDQAMSADGWNDPFDFCISTDLYVLIDGVWTVQTMHFLDVHSFPCNQSNVRAWAINDNTVIGSAHDESYGSKFPWENIDIHHSSNTGPDYWERSVPTFGAHYHILTGFDSAEDAVADAFSGTCWDVGRDSVWLNNEYVRKMYKNDVLEGTARNDGYATRITCS